MIIILYVMDTLRLDFLGCYGYHKKTSPNIDRIAEDGIVFKNCFAQSTWTRPSGASILTSTYPSVHKVITIYDVLSAKIPTLPILLKKKGFKNIAISAMGNISPSFGFGNNFDHFIELYKEKEVLDRRQNYETKSIGWQHHFKVDSVTIATSEDINKFLFPFLEAEIDNHLFVFIWSIDTHDPYFHRDPNLAHFCTPTPKIFWNKDITRMRLKKKRDLLKKVYEDMIFFNDYNIGMLIEKLKEVGLYDQTFFIIASDHGECFGEHGENGHARLPYDEQIRVPLLLKFPYSRFSGRQVNSLVQHIDLAPTILEYLGISLKRTGFQGKSLLALLDGQQELNEFVFTQTQLTRSSPQHTSLRTISHKYIERKPGKTTVYSSLKKPLSALKQMFEANQLLFSLKEDPGENNNIARQEKSTLKLLESLARSVSESNERQYCDLTREESQDRDIDERVAKQLKALGYL